MPAVKQQKEGNPAFDHIAAIYLLDGAAPAGRPAGNQGNPQNNCISVTKWGAGGRWTEKPESDCKCKIWPLLPRREKNSFQSAEFAKKNGYAAVLDGTNYRRSQSYRPGIRGQSELGVISPLSDPGTDQAGDSCSCRPNGGFPVR